MLHRNIWTGVLGSVSMTFMTGGVFFTLYCQRMGMETYQFGVISTLTSMVMPLFLLSSALEVWFGQRKYPWFVLAMVSRLMLAPLILGLFMPVSPWFIVGLMVVVVAIGTLISPLWISWTWDYYPIETFGQFTARRAFWTTFGTAVAGIVMAVVVTRTPADTLKVISALFAVLLVLGIVDLIYHVEIPEPPPSAPTTRGNVGKILNALRKAQFRNQLLAVGIWYFAVSIGGPFCLPYMMKDLGFGQGLMSAVVLVHAIPAAGTLVTLRLWGKLADTKHPGLIVSVCCLAWATIPFFYFLARPHGATWPLTVAWIIGGTFPAGYTIALPILTRRVAGDDKTTFAALVAMVASLGATLGSAFGTFSLTYCGAPNVFMVSFVARVTAAFIMFLLLVYQPAMQHRRQAAR
jgi:MFS family permease